MGARSDPNGSGLAEEEFPRSMPWFPRSSLTNPDWRFLSIGRVMETPRGHEAAYNEMKELLHVAKNSAFKIWKLVPALKNAAMFLLAAAFIAVVFACFHWGDSIWASACAASAPSSYRHREVFSSAS